MRKIGSLGNLWHFFEKTAAEGGYCFNLVSTCWTNGGFPVGLRTGGEADSEWQLALPGKLAVGGTITGGNGCRNASNSVQVDSSVGSKER